MRSQYPGWLLLVITLILTSLTGCSREQDSPEAQIRALLKNAELAAESGDFRELTKLLTDNFQDSRGRDKQAISKLLRIYFLRNKSIHLITRIQSVDFPAPDHAQVELAIAMTAKPTHEQQGILNINADMHRFNLSIVKQDNKDWQVLYLKWDRKTRVGR